MFRWKHLENPFGPSVLLVAEASDRIIGLRAFMRWEFQVEDRTVRAVRAVDTATHPDYRGRGLFTRLTMEALETLRADTDLVFNTPNAKSGPGYLKMGWRPVTTVRVLIRPRRPVRLLRNLRSRDAKPPPSSIHVDAPSAADVLEGSDGLDRLLQISERDPARFSTPRSRRIIGWRYGPRSPLDYRVVTERQGGVLRGLAVFRVRPRAGLWQASISDLLVPPGEVQVASRLLRGVVEAAPVDYVAAYFPLKSSAARAARRRAFLRSPRGMRFVVNPLAADLQPDPVASDSWALVLGDLEVF